jgi:hypothetical protein
MIRKPSLPPHNQASDEASQADQLPAHLLWNGHHPSELALSALADGERAVVGDPVWAHVASCPTCMDQLSELALITADLQSLVASAAIRTPAPAPWAAVAVVAVVGLGTSAYHWWQSGMRVDIREGALRHLLGRVASNIAREPSTLSIAATTACAVISLALVWALQPFLRQQTQRSQSL